METLKKIFYTLVIMISLGSNSFGAMCTALTSGNWSNPANWSCGTVPSCGDFIDIPAGVTILVDMQVDLDENSSPACSTAMYMQISGVLQFITGNKISLACGSGVEVMPGGAMLPGGGGGSSNWLKICDVTEWKTSDGPVFGYKLFGSPSPLPVEFISFDIQKVNDQFTFVWNVASERENDFFSLEYSSDGLNWTVFSHVTSIGDHSDEYSYVSSANLEYVTSELIYFRLRQTDKNGKSSLLDMKSYKNAIEEFVVYPNPVASGDNVHLKIISIKVQDSEFILLNALGVIVFQQNISLEEGLNNLNVNIDSIESGIYFVKLSGTTHAEPYRLVIE